MPPRLLMILTENHTLVDPRDLRGLVDLAVTAERTGFDGVMISEHVALGASACEHGLPLNPRMYAAPGNQDPTMAWPSQIVMASAVAASTKRIRIVLGAVIAPLRHPVQLAKDLATLDLLSQGRLVVQPTVSWHRDEYLALGVPFEKRGRILDEQLEAMFRLWGPSPASYHGEFFDFTDVYCEPRPYRETGPRLWFGGQSMHSPLLRRLVRWGHGFHPFGSPTVEDLSRLRDALEAQGRSLNELEMVGGTRAEFQGKDDVADIDAAMSDFPNQLNAGYSTFCMKPSQHTNDVAEVEALCCHMVNHVATLSVIPS